MKGKRINESRMSVRWSEICTSRYVRHALVNDGVLASLADHQIGPLDDHDRHEERRVTRELQHLALSIRLHTRTHTRTDMHHTYAHTAAWRR